ncbi:28S ribosomal protein S18b, mitochondrial [Lucilia sericata]|uniref:28S ribosomal protein S18b, mitochondrial n=1 Tax=Lucilia sericata TaxID=13632 RepID=UPI0018A813E9|nr:28S ribosomal protein S18b, mitochondrial [Lucilia sericata]
MISFSRGLGNILTRIAFSNTGTSVHLARTLQTTCTLDCEIKQQQQEEPTDSTLAADEGAPELQQEQRELTEQEQKLLRKDRSRKIPVETSIRYLKSDAYKQTYGAQFVWEQYRRNHKGLFPPRKTRKTCIRKDTITTGNPCPICRDEYLVLDHRNIELLKQFISPHSGEVLSYTKTGLCQKKHLQLLVAVERAKDYGLLTFDVPYRNFDYSEFYGKVEAKN